MHFMQNMPEPFWYRHKTVAVCCSCCGLGKAKAAAQLLALQGLLAGIALRGLSQATGWDQDTSTSENNFQHCLKHFCSCSTL